MLVVISNINRVDSRGRFHVDWHVKISLWECQDKVNTFGTEAVDLCNYEKKPNASPSNYWGIGFPLVLTPSLLTTMHT